MLSFTATITVLVSAPNEEIARLLVSGSLESTIDVDGFTSDTQQLDVLHVDALELL